MARVTSDVSSNVLSTPTYHARYSYTSTCPHFHTSTPAYQQRVAVDGARRFGRRVKLAAERCTRKEVGGVQERAPRPVADQVVGVQRVVLGVDQGLGLRGDQGLGLGPRPSPRPHPRSMRWIMIQPGSGVCAMPHSAPVTCMPRAATPRGGEGGYSRDRG